MKASELIIGDLMIGDWVNFIVDVVGGEDEHTPAVNEYQPMQVGSISSLDKVGSVFFGVTNDVSQLQPISLTAEILERNGFNMMPKDACGYDNAIWGLDTERGVCVELRTEYGKGLTIWNDTDNDEESLIYLLPLPRYVHELQHALRLCGIDKNIEL